MSLGNKAVEAILTVICFIISVAIHEFGHAFVADRLGDNTPRRQGRVSLNPWVHTDILGTIIFPLLGVLSTRGGWIGWGKPVMTRPANYTRKLTMTQANLLVSLAGPFMNLLLAVVVTFIFAAGLKTGLLSLGNAGDSGLDGISRGLGMLVSLNWGLMMFNLLPIPPLDGGSILEAVLPRRHHHLLAPLRQPYAFILVLVLFSASGLAHYWYMPANYLEGIVMRLAATLFGL